MGERLPLNYLEIDAYMRATRTELTAWEVDMIKQLSHVYIVQSQKKDTYEFPPFMNGVDEFTYLSSLKK